MTITSADSQTVKLKLVSIATVHLKAHKYKIYMQKLTKKDMVSATVTGFPLDSFFCRNYINNDYS